MRIPKRVIVGCHTFICGILQSGFHVILSINIIAMVLHEDKKNKPNPLLNVDYGPRYDWSPVIQAYLHCAFLWGTIPALFLSGWVIERVSTRNLISWSIFFASVFTALVPLICNISWICLFVLRYLCGCCSGFLFPCFHNLVTKWVPPKEKGVFMSLMMSGNLGTYLIWNITGLIIKHCGWYFAWELLPIITLLWICVFRCTIYDSPSEHPSISEKEKSYILETCPKSLSVLHRGYRKIPYKLIYSSCPVWSLSVLSFGNVWGLIFVSTYTPTYLTEILGEEIQSAGQKSGIPFLCRFIMATLFGITNDYLVKSHRCTPKILRKVFCVCSHIIPGITLIGVIFVGYNVYAVISLCVISQAFNGAISVTAMLNMQELSPNFSGTISGLILAFASCGASLSIPINGVLTGYKNTIEMWHISYLVAGLLYIVSGCVFILFGSTEVQSFNNLP